MNPFHNETDAARSHKVPAVRVLLIHSDETLAKQAAPELTSLGCELSLAENLEQALALVQERRFDLLLLDGQWIVEGGEAVVKSLRGASRGKHLRIIVLVAGEETQPLRTCLQRGADDYLVTPFDAVLWGNRLKAIREAVRWRDQESSYGREIQKHQKHAADLSRVILPEHVADELEETQGVEPRRFEQVGVLFCGIPGFGSYCDSHSPEMGVRPFQSLVGMFELLTLQHNLEKIKTVGGSFMAVTGLPHPVENPALGCVRGGLAMIGAAQSMPPQWQVRVGVHVGTVVAGVVGHRKYQFDVWGNTVALAAGLEQAAEPGTVCVQKDLWPSLAAHCQGRPHGPVSIPGQGNQELFLIESLLA